MKLKSLLLATLFVASTQAQAAEGQPYSLEQLDVLKTCATAAQKTTAEKGMSFLENFRWWNIKNLMQSLHPDYQQLHTSRVFAASVTPLDKVPSLPFKNGIVSKETFIQDLAMIAFTNDLSKYIVEMKRLECLGDDTVMISTVFNGLNAIRDPKSGKAYYQSEIKDLQTRFILTVKDGLIHRDIIDIKDSESAEIYKKLAEVIQTGKPNVPPGTIPDQTYEQILKDFSDKAAE